MSALFHPLIIASEHNTIYDSRIIEADSVSLYRELSKLKESQNRHSIARNIFQLLVLESGVDWYSSPSVDDTEGVAVALEEGKEVMGSKTLLKYMLEPID